MEKNNYPVIKEISLDSIFSHLKNRFKINTGDAYSEIFGNDKYARETIRGDRTLEFTQVNYLLDYIRKQCLVYQIPFIDEMVAWYPDLMPYTDELQIFGIIKANLLNYSDKDIHIINTEKSRIKFLESCLNNKWPIKCIKMAAHTGWKWFGGPEENELLVRLAEKQIEIQVIGNPKSPEMRNIIVTMSDPTKEGRYFGVNKALEKWHDYEKKYSNIHFLVSDIYPILRQLLIVDFIDGSSRVFLRDYVYGSPVTRLSPCKQIDDTHPDYIYYSKEFDFLWKHAKSYEEWIESLPESEELIECGDYLMIDLLHGNITNDRFEDPSKCVYSALSFRENNKVYLKDDVTIDFHDSQSTLEYEYEGNAKLTRKNIFISLYNSESQELINISIPRPLRYIKRFIGIMSKLTPSGQPVAFKFACFEKSLLYKIDYLKLDELLNTTNREYSETRIMLENKDIDLFYSNMIFQ